MRKNSGKRKDANISNGNKLASVKRWRSTFLLTDKFKETIEKNLGFQLDDLKSFENFVNLLYRPTDSASLGVCRALFGLCMVLDVVDERGLADIDLKWGDPYSCHFPLIHNMRPPALPWMIVLYAIMWMGAFGIMLGFCFKLACACFVIPYWYIFLLDKSFWNNHSYLYGLVSLLFWLTNADRYFSINSLLSHQKEETVPLWNYSIIKFQFFVLYFFAGMKKFSKEWLEGYAMTNLSTHWVFNPFKLFLTIEQTDYLIVHWFGFFFDLTVGFWMLFDKTRMPAMLFCAAFHLMNSRLFSIGMFPYACLATMPLFCNVDWPRKIVKSFVKTSKVYKTYDCRHISNSKKNTGIGHTSIYQLKNSHKTNGEIQKGRESENEDDGKPVIAWMPRPDGYCVKKKTNPTKKQKILVSLLLLHVGLQLFLPYSHFITRGYNNWTPGLYGYSWDMMIHSWDTILTVIRVHDNENNKDHFIDPRAWVQNDRWSKHGDMVIQYAQCLKENLLRRKEEVLKSNYKAKDKEDWSKFSSNLSIYVDVRSSVNSRFQQRVFDPHVDMLTVDWHPLKPVKFLMPLLTQFNSYRHKMDEITHHVYTWSNYTDVLFVADYPQLQLENYFSNDFSNVSLSILGGQVKYSEEDSDNVITVNKDQIIPVSTNKLHKVTTTSADPSCYMYTYTNRKREQLEKEGIISHPRKRTGFPILEELKYRVDSWWRALGQIANAFFNLVYDVPIMRRVPRSLRYHEDY